MEEYATLIAKQGKLYFWDLGEETRFLHMVLAYVYPPFSK